VSVCTHATLGGGAVAVPVLCPLLKSVKRRICVSSSASTTGSLSQKGLGRHNVGLR